MKRSKHSLSHYKLLTCDMGQLVPVGVVEALPGDTFQQSTSLLLRMSPLVAPVMHPVSVRLHHWFVPMRIMWDGWEDFITGGPDGTGTEETFPTNEAAQVVAEKSLPDYMGIPPETYQAGIWSLLPMYAYNMIFNEFYRDEDLAAARDLDDLTIAKVAWEKDYFTTARPWTQKGPEVVLPLGGMAPLVTTGDAWGVSEVGGTGSTGNFTLPGSGTVTNNISGISGGAAKWSSVAGSVGAEADLSGATGASINAVRQAFALQRYQEARAQYGSRYTEYLRYLGVRSSDARLQRPEYLGGGKQTVAFSEVLRTGSLSDEAAKPVGQLKGHGISALRSNRYRYFCEEHGYILTLMSIRPRSMYVQGIDRTYLKRTKEDFYQKELELIGQQEILKAEVFADGTTANDLDGWGAFQDRYAEYRHQYSNVAAEFRTTLDYWHLARKFMSIPTLNESFIGCDPSKRVFAEQTANSCWVMVSHSIQARRLLGKKTIGRVI